jgi:uncharacterized protein (DUF302 family)
MNSNENGGGETVTLLLANKRFRHMLIAAIAVSGIALSILVFLTLCKNLASSFEKAIADVTEELKKEGFGILTEIDVTATLKKKLNVDFPKYTILGACNPPLAYKALQAEAKIGTMLPCNVIVQELADGTIDVAAVDPLASMQSIRNPELQGISPRRSS